LGFDVVERHGGYLVTHAHGVEIHFRHAPDNDPRPTTTAHRDAPLVFIHVHDAAAFWQRLMGEGIDGVGPVQDMDYGLREFVITDPDGNRVRIGGAAHC
jgi:uncharacterized glyoxalase superfamily protein PhnB